MLRFNVNRRELSDDTEQIAFTSYDITRDGEYFTVTFFYNGDCPVTLNEEIQVNFSYNRDESGVENAFVYSIDSNNQSFTIRIPAVNPLAVISTVLTEDEDGYYLHILFNGATHYDVGDTINVTARYYDGNMLRTIVLHCEYVSPTEVRWRLDDRGEDNAAFIRSMFHNDRYELIDPPEGVTIVTLDTLPSIVGYGDPMYVRINSSPFYEYTEVADVPEGIEWTENTTVYSIPKNPTYNAPEYLRLRTETGFRYFKRQQCPGTWEYYHRICEDGDITDIEFFIEDNSLDFDFVLLHPKYRTSLIIPIQQMFDTRTRQEELILDEFVTREKHKSINDIVEMEKYCHRPVFPIFHNDVIGGYQNVTKIKFNLHFRQHRGENWTVADESFWNGVDNSTITLLDNVSNSSSIPSRTFFSYQGGLESKQSDLLTYMGFTDQDVKYQKSRLKKTFLRLLFYDSDVASRQHMLGYSTVYMDYGLLFQKYMANVNTYPYTSPNGQMFTSGRETFTGAKVDREPDITPQNDGVIADLMSSGLRDDALNDQIETLRLSSQFVIEDRELTLSSSEGFYIYLWVDNEDGVIPTNLYMKVELNHAGYGRTIPFMMPYFEPEIEGRTGIKTFQEILADWRTNNEYDIRRYQRYSYIKLKSVYDSANRQHVYYLDDEVYGYNNVQYMTGDTELEFNLYEAKISTYSQNDRNPNTTPSGQGRRNRNTTNCL